MDAAGVIEALDDNTETDLEVGGAAGTLGGYVIQFAKASGLKRRHLVFSQTIHDHF